MAIRTAPISNYSLEAIALLNLRVCACARVRVRARALCTLSVEKLLVSKTGFRKEKKKDKTV